MKAIAVCGAMAACLIGLAAPAAGRTSVSNIQVDSVQLIGSTRISRTVFENEYRVAITNNNGALLSGLQAKVSTLDTATFPSVPEPDLDFGNVGAGASAQSTDTFKVQWDRRHPFDLGKLQFDFTALGPVADAGACKTVAVSTLVVLDGTASHDADSQGELTFAWTIIGKPGGSAATLADATTPKPSFTVDVAGDYAIELMVTSSIAGSDTDTVVISTTDCAPVADAAADQTVPVSAAAKLDASKSTDFDGDALTFLWQILSAPAGSSAAIGNTTAVITDFVPDVAGDYRFQLTATANGESSTDEVIISTTNSAPVPNAGPDQFLSSTGAVNLDGSGSTDVDGDLLTYAWSFVFRPGGSAASLNDAAAVQPSFTADVAGLYIVQLLVTDSNGVVSHIADTVAIMVGTVFNMGNLPPVADAGPDRTVAAGNGETLDGTGSSDPNSDGLTYRWDLIVKPAGSSAALTNELTDSPSITPDIAGTYVVQLIVRDTSAKLECSPPDTIVLTTTNSRPVADAGTYPGAQPPSFNLDGTASSDSDGALPSNGHKWAILSKPAGATASITGNDLQPAFTADMNGLYVVQLIVNDGAMDSHPATAAFIVVVASADLSITKTDSADPVAIGANFTYTITVTNAGPDDAENVVVTDTLPGAVTLVSTTGCTEDPNGAPTCSLGTITSGNFAQLTITVTAPATPAALSNNVSVASTTPDPNNANNSTSEGTTVINPAPVISTDPVNLDTLGNVGLEVAGTQAVSGAVFLASNLQTLASVTDADPLTFSISGTSPPTNGVANITDPSTGEFTYTPNSGAAADSFGVDVFDGFNTVSFTVNIAAQGRVLFVDNSVAGGAGTGSGTLADPFHDISDGTPGNASTDVEDQSAAGDTIFILEGDSVTDLAGYNQGFVAKSGQRILGEPFGLTTGPACCNGNNNQVLIAPSGNRPRLDAPGGSADITVATSGSDLVSIEIRELNLIGSLNGISVQASGTDSASLTIDSVTVGETSTGPTGAGVSVTNSGTGSVQVGFSNSTVQSTGGDGFFANNTGSGIAITSFAGNTFVGTITGDGVDMTGVVFDANPADADFLADTVGGGNTVIGSLADRVGGNGLVLTNARGDLSFSDLDIANTAGTGLIASSTNNFNAAAGTGFRLGTGSGSTVDTSNGGGISITGVDFGTSTFRMAGVTQSGAANGIVLSLISGNAELGALSINATSGIGLSATKGVGAASVSNTSGTIVASGGAVGLQLDGVTSSLTLSSLAIQGATTGIDIDNLAATSTVTSTTTTIGTTTAVGKGIDIDSSACTCNFGDTAVGDGDTAATSGVELNTNTGTYTYNTLFINASGGHGLVASNAGTVNVTTAAGSSISATNGIGASISNTAMGIGLTSLGATGGTHGAFFNTTTGSFSAGAGGTITNTSVAGVEIDGSSGTIAIGSNISTSTGRPAIVKNLVGTDIDFTGTVASTANGVLIQNNTTATAKTIDFTNQVTLNTGANNAVQLDNNDTATVTFSGGLDTTTTSGRGFNAINGAAGINVTGAGNTIASTTGRALNIENSTIGASGLSFQSIAANGADTGVNLNATGSSGGVTVTGSGGSCNPGNTTCTGGTIQNTTGDAIALNNTQDFSATLMRILSPGGHGIGATNLRGSNLWATGLITGVSTSAKDGIRVQNTNTNLTLFEVNASNFVGVAGSGNDGIFFDMKGTSVGRIDVLNNSHFNGLAGDGVQVLADDASNVTANVKNSRFSNDSSIQTANASRLSLRAADGSLPQTQGGTLTAVVDANTLNDTGTQTGSLPVGLTGVLDVIGDQFSNLTLTITNNVIQNIDVDGAIRVIMDDSTQSLTALIDSNTINNVVDAGIFFHTRDTAGTSNVTISNNRIGTGSDGNVGGGDDQPVANGDAPNAFVPDGIRIFAQEQSGTTNVKISGNKMVTRGQQGIDADSDGSSIGTPLLNLTIHNNEISNIRPASAGDGFDIEADNGGQVCLDLNGDAVAGNINIFSGGDDSTVDRESDGGTFFIEDLTGGATAAAVDTFLSNGSRNSITPNLDVDSNTYTSVAQCTEPTLP